MKSTAALTVLLFLSLPAAAHRRSAKSYPLHGVVVAVQARRVRPGMLLGPGGGLSVAIRRGSYRIETKDAFYEFEEHGKHPSLSLNEKIAFRVRKDNAYVLEPNGKEKKYRIIGEESKPPKSP